MVAEQSYTEVGDKQCHVEIMGIGKLEHDLMVDLLVCCTKDIEQEYAEDVDNLNFAEVVDEQNFAEVVDEQNFAEVADAQNFVEVGDEQNFAEVVDEQNFAEVVDELEHDLVVVFLVCYMKDVELNLVWIVAQELDLAVVLFLFCILSAEQDYAVIVELN
ncbi:hypothetical protein BpHYR1_035921 [Brachionus plicatilis]|uniref:Uncharacterized protein n=1 Tax=Brachionus plicatilis TaxID=10195 RepID=A0A3M7QSC3_BRAPC|nr:hypothetical protein BpHYR1_035921 [Brachionus plicatilis]